MEAGTPPRLRLGLPKGRLQDGVIALFADAGVDIRLEPRGYRAHVSIDGVEAKILKPQNIVEMLDAGSRDVGLAGADWVAELGAEVVELLDTKLDPVSLVAAAPENLVTNGRLPQRPLVVASEYENLTRSWIERAGIQARFVRSYGATEVFPPEDADCIVDNRSTGSTLRANNLTVVDELLRSSTRFFASPRALDDPDKRATIDHLVLLLRSVLDARERVMLEVNVTRDALEAVASMIPCMREPTVSTLSHDAGFAIKAAVPRRGLPQLIPEIKARGGTDVVVTEISQIVP